MKIKAKGEFSVWKLFVKDEELPAPFDEWSIAERVSDWIEEKCYAMMCEKGISSIRIQTRGESDLSVCRVALDCGVGVPIEYHPKTSPWTIAKARKAMPKRLRDLLDEADEQEFKFEPES